MLISPNSWLEQGQFLDWCGQRIFYRVEGTGEPLLLLHGFPTSSWDWQHLWSGLASRYRLIALDYVGFGFSSKPLDGPYSVLAYADQAKAVLAHLGIASVDILAHDLGDSVAQELMARDLDRRDAKLTEGLTLRSVCMLNGGIFPELHRPRPVQRLLDSPLGFVVSRLLNAKRFEKAFREVLGPQSQLSAEELAGFWDCMSRDHGTRNYHRLIRYMRERRVYRERWVDAVLDPHFPLAFINGLVDPVSGAHVAERLQELRPSAQIFPLENIGHYPQTEAPDQVLAAYREFRAQ